ncbi:MAG: DUF1232 domain-containing protein [Gammaproteobacteria bacterium]|nr:DUF1232 domain-containing protein [Gammaproteobacteria bacterium]
MSAWLDGLKQQARRLKRECYALYFAARDPRTPWYAKMVVAMVVAYAFSPIDLIPDFIPVLGYLDDLLLLPLGIMLAIKLVPVDIMAECRARAETLIVQGKPVSRVAAVIIVLLWLALAALLGWWLYQVILPE